MTPIRARRRTSPRLAALAGAVLLALPAAAGADNLLEKGFEAVRSLLSAGHSRTEWVDSRNGRRIEVDVHGEVELSDDDRDIVALSPGGSFDLAVGDGRSQRRVRIRRARDGELLREWSDGDRWQPWNAEAAAFLAEVLPGFVRESGLGAERRVERFLAAGGPDAVLDEAAQIRGDWARTRYLTALFDRAALDPVGQVRALRMIESGRSDYEKSRLLRRGDWMSLARPEVREAFLAAASTVTSGYESRRILSALLGTPELAAADLEEILRLAARIDSDYEKATVLRSIAPENLTDEAMVATFIEVADSIGSAYERRRALGSLLTEKRLADRHVARVLESVAGVGSDYEKATLLMQIARGQPLDASARQAYLETADSIGSAYERRRSLVALLDAGGLSEVDLARLLRVVAAISSDYEKATVLVRAAEAEYLAGEAAREYVRAAAAVGGGYERQRSLIAFARSARPDRESLAALLELVAALPSDHETATVLTEVAPLIAADEVLLARYLEIAESLDSDGEYRKAVRALGREAVSPRAVRD